MGFGGTSPCAQTQGERVYIDRHPEKMLISGDFAPKDIVFGSNKHEGSFVLGVMYNNYIDPRGLMHDSDFLTHDFLPTMLNALGLHDSSGVIFEVVEHDYFNITDLGMWDEMMPGMINVSNPANSSSFRKEILIHPSCENMSQKSTGCGRNLGKIQHRHDIYQPLNKTNS